VNELDFGLEFAKWAEVELTGMFTHTFTRTRTSTFPYGLTRDANRFGLQVSGTTSRGSGPGTGAGSSNHAMSVASHLGIRTAEYARQILTFIPHYDEILDQAAGALVALDRPAKVVLDLGTGTGALAARCLARLRGARVGIDGDEAMQRGGQTSRPEAHARGRLLRADAVSGV
jgi:hypothetical protein